MELSVLAVIGISLATMFFGYFFGLFEGRGQGYKKRKKEEATEQASRPAAVAPPPPTNLSVEPEPRVMQPAEKSLLRLSLDARQQPCLDMDDRRIDTMQMSPVERKRLIDLMVLMRPWIDAGPVQRWTAAPAPRPAAPEQPAPPPAPPPLAGPAAIPDPASPPTTMVVQIDAILQTKLVGTP